MTKLFYDKVPDLDYPPDFADLSLHMNIDGGNFAPWSFVSFLDDKFTDFSTSDEMSTSSKLSTSVPAFTLDRPREIVVYLRRNNYRVR
jgi:hypothetical protein